LAKLTHTVKSELKIKDPFVLVSFVAIGLNESSCQQTWAHSLADDISSSCYKVKSTTNRRGQKNPKLLLRYNEKPFIPFIPFVGIAWPQSQFPHSCVCE
jgi:hypothetical protein